ncbi:MAG TPA: pectinesterase family protein [Bacteroidales bacterium]|jgi:pectinesterase|nr:pectin esterase [Bacteroidales bacterium]HOD26182.1 pectinesterase family protein [Bacteroidales bacterium]HPH56681.1 pectinesterase family protein [Bacteroidales bacterium]HPN46354.1 pectinesterase family protein [Bacteroidales bacterium]HQM93577.1 pectinesterase family protein [Bacteroidales bacterium]
MKSKFLLLALTAGLLFSFAPERKIVVYTIGDSTMANKPLDNMSLERGWGQVLSAYLDSRYVEVDNHARNGRSSLSFRNEGLWAPIYDKIKPGDYVLIQFGHNDEKPSPDRHTEPGSTFNEQLRRYVLETREKGGVPVLLTPIVRRKFDEEGRLIPTHGDYPQAVRDVAAELDVILIDHNVLSRRLVQDLGPEASKELFMWVPPGTNPALPQGKEDDTHLRALGAKRIARLVLDEIKEKIPALAVHVREYDFVVAKDGSGDFFTVQEAINAVPDFRKNGRTTIFIRNGVYKEKLILPESKINVSFIGESVEHTILTYDDYAQKLNIFGESKSTSGSSSFFMYAPDFWAENITFQNSAGPVGQAVAIFVSGDRAVFKNCRFLGFQDTLYTYGKYSRQYYENCYIEGTVDFIFGSSTAVFKDCEIRSKRDAYITAASTPQGRDYGYVFINCKLTADPGVEKVFLGRPWRPYAQTVFIHCEMGAHIRPEGWNNWGNVSNEKTAFYAEYGSSGPGADISGRVPWAKKLNKKKLAAYSIEKVLAGDDGWNPVGAF